MNPLEPCPFCGCSDVSMYTNGSDLDNYSYVVECDGCGCTLDTGFDSEERAIEEWNLRKEPKRTTGEWIEYPDSLRYEGAYADDQIVCSECHHVFSILDNCTEEFDFCPHCGADMRG